MTTPVLVVKPLLEVWLAMKTVSESNLASHAHWRKRDQRSSAQINQVIASLYRISVHERAAWAALRLPMHVVLHRHSKATKPLDDDNLPASLKHVQDGVCDALGLYMPAGTGPRRMSEDPLAKNKHFDDSDRLSWSYRQTTSAPREGVGVRFYAPGTMMDAMLVLAREQGVDALAQWMQANAGELDRILP